MTHDSDKLIRQLSLVAYLMAEQRPVTARDVKNNVEGYANMGDEAFARRYYADRSELQGLGVPITSGRDEFTGEELYNLRQEQYFLPPIDLTDAELAALQTSFYLLEGQFAYAEPLRLALQNLALGRAQHQIDPGPKTATVELLGSVYTPEIAQRLAKLEQAISKQRTVRFTYWSARRDQTAERTVNPYGLFELNGVWYVVGDDQQQADEGDPRKTFRISRMRGEIKFATRRERDFRIPADFNVTRYRDRLPWELDPEPAGTARLAVSPDSVWLVNRLYGAGGGLEEHDDGSATLTTDYSSIPALSQAVLAMNGRMRPIEPQELVDQVATDLARIAELHSGGPSDPAREVAAPEPRADAAPRTGRSQGPVAPERFALLQALLAFLLERCGDDPSATVATADLRQRFHLSQEELQDHLDLLNLVNFGGGCYAVYCSTENGSVLVDKELYGDTFRRPARLSPLEAKALLRALDVVAPLLAAEAHTSLETVREKVERSFGQYELPDTPEPQGAKEESAVTTLNEGVRQRKLVRIGYHSRSSDEFSERVVEPYLLRRDEKGWYVEAYDRTKGGRRTFKVAFVRDAALLDETFEPREEMQDLVPQLGGVVGTARILFSAERGRYEREGRPDVAALADGGALADVRYGSLEWLVPEILKNRGEAEVLDPPVVRERVREAAQQLLRTLTPAAAR
ncbi:MAG: proteasome accessory factor [Gaiellales bacterium]|jgi:proteasome accessory factor C|nr:proteasome accessory factor [Gaiellales bacterium]